ncbi:outer membrane protein [Ancylobacter amanitiformis]|uniref:Outer membrane immunogenic protein n=1 Tax=Ancylobacter amanitiformis TaxID=217069 RepID=A0ABU0LPD0_9HYPH|nr:outer membrane protein [Ancylobacter amanitiformis]MDQ0510560.1 outer membrane immunogenic protein [Ancylobacter amanitiformis]
MNKLSCAVLVAGSMMVAGGVQAADMSMPVKAEPVIVIPSFSWTGFYVGGNLGYAWGDMDYSYSVSAMSLYYGDSASLSPDGITGGVQVGYNYQFDNNWVIGAEADFQWADLSDSAGGSNLFYGPLSSLVAIGGTQYSIGSKVEWFGTVRARLGYAWDRLLVYGTGGVAYGSVDTDVAVSGSLTGYTMATTQGTSQTQWGWTVGGGAEYALTDNWTIRAEYLYVDLGSQVVYSVTDPVIAGGVTLDTAFSVVRAGVNYKF